MTSDRVSWRFNNKIRTMSGDASLRIETRTATRVHWSIDGWQTVHDQATRDTTCGVHVADLEIAGLSSGVRVDFTFYWLDAHQWEGTDFVVTVEECQASS